MEKWTYEIGSPPPKIAMGAMMEQQKSQFNGFTLPDGAWLPPELLYVLPFLSFAQLKDVIVAIYHYAQVGGGESLTLNDFQTLTGLSRSPVIAAINWLLGENEHGLQLLERVAVDRSFSYRPRLNIESRVSRLSERESERKLINLIKDSLSDSLKAPAAKSESLETRLSLIQELRSAGVYLKTAQGLVAQYPEAQIREKLAHFPYALQFGFAQGPGWLVTAIKENWPPPLGYESHQRQAALAQSQVVPICPECHTHPCTCNADLEAASPAEGVPSFPPYTGPEAVSQAWAFALGLLRDEMPKAAYETWVRDVVLVALEEDTVVVGAVSSHARDWLNARVARLLANSLTGAMNREIQVRFIAPDQELHP